LSPKVLAEYSVPSLSVVDVHFERHIRVAAELIVKLLGDREVDTAGNIIQPPFIQRASTAAPKPPLSTVDRPKTTNQRGFAATCGGEKPGALGRLGKT